VYLDVLVEWPTAFAEVLAVMSAAIKPDDSECPVCKAHRAKENASAGIAPIRQRR
jgi:hypothetical protein